MRILAFRVGNRLIVEGLRIFFTQQAIGRLGAVPAVVVGVVTGSEPELVRPAAPVENVGIAGRLPPVDE